MKTVEEILDAGGPAAELLKEKSLRLLDQIGRMHDRSTPRLSATDAKVTTKEARRAQIYAHDINAKGASMRGRSCREPVPADTTRWPIFMMDSDVVDTINNYDDAKSYAESCRKLWRK
jgi:hypothetical protein